MSTHKAQWHLIAYDITDPKRLQKMGKLMKKKAIPLQKSVYFLLATPPQIAQLLTTIETIIHPKYDDVRLYPIDDISTVWLSGKASTPDLLVAQPQSIWQKMKQWIQHKRGTQSPYPTALQTKKGH